MLSVDDRKLFNEKLWNGNHLLNYLTEPRANSDDPRPGGNLADRLHGVQLALEYCRHTGFPDTSALILSALLPECATAFSRGYSAALSNVV